MSGNPGKAEVLDKTKVIGGTKVHYKVVLPNNYDAGKAYPVILGFGGGPQTIRFWLFDLSKRPSTAAVNSRVDTIIPA